jgi:hypothetical protein
MKSIAGKAEYIRSLGMGATVVGNDLHVGVWGPHKWRFFVLCDNPSYRRIRAYLGRRYSKWLLK